MLTSVQATHQLLFSCILAHHSTLRGVFNTIDLTIFNHIEAITNITLSKDIVTLFEYLGI